MYFVIIEQDIGFDNTRFLRRRYEERVQTIAVLCTPCLYCTEC